MAKAKKANVKKTVAKKSKIKPIKSKSKSKSKSKIKPKSDKRQEMLEKILDGIKDIEYAPRRKRIMEAEPHLETILPTRAIPSMERFEEEGPEAQSPAKARPPRETSHSKSEAKPREVQLIKSLVSSEKPKAALQIPKTIKTGISGFDEMCGGGIEEKSKIGRAHV